MKTSLRDPLLIAVALLTILGCGFGLGRLGPGPNVPAVPQDTVSPEFLSIEVAESLQNSLNLSPEQLATIQPEIASLSAEVFDIRHEALVEYYDSLLRFHDRLLPMLDTEQQEQLRRNRELLRAERSKRFPNHHAPPTSTP